MDAMNTPIPFFCPRNTSASAIQPFPAQIFGTNAFILRANRHPVIAEASAEMHHTDIL